MWSTGRQSAVSNLFDISFGGGFRLGPLSVGSGSIFSNLLSDSSKTTDVFVGLKIPLYRK